MILIDFENKIITGICKAKDVKKFGLIGASQKCNLK